MPTDRPPALLNPPPLADEDLAGLDALERSAHARRSPTKVWAAVWPKAAAVLLALGLWQATVWSGWKPDFALPGPGRVFPVLFDNLTTAEFWKAIATTMRRAVTGFAISIALGTLVGAAVTRSRTLRRAVGSLITGLQTMPSITWFPLAILLFNLSEGAILFVVVLGATPSIANGLIGGVDHIPPLLLRAAKTLGARGWTLMRSVVLPAALPGYLGGLKQGWAFAWRSLMAGELLTAAPRRDAHRGEPADRIRRRRGQRVVERGPPRKPRGRRQLLPLDTLPSS